MPILYITNLRNDTLGSAINALFQWKIFCNSLQKNDSLIIDFSRCNFVSPSVLVGIHSIYIELLKKGINVDFNLNSPCRSYLENVYFPQSLNIIDPQRNSLAYYNNRSYFPLTQLPLRGNPGIRDQIISSITNLIYTQLKADYKLQTVISYLFSELIDNMVEHSDCEIGYVLGQSYTTKNYLEISFADSGIGLLESYFRSSKFMATNCLDAVNLALNGNSTKQDYYDARGFGIRTSKSILVNGLNGRFFLLTGNAFNYDNKIKNDVILIENEPIWQEGCIYSLRVPLQLPPEFNIYQFV